MQWFIFTFLLVLFLNQVQSEEIFQPDENENNTEAILLRQENQLGSVVELLSQIRDLINNTNTNNNNNNNTNTDNTSATTEIIADTTATTEIPKDSCNTGFSSVDGGSCFHVNYTVREGGSQQAGLTWRGAGIYCREMGTDLAVFTHANAYVQALDFIHNAKDNNDIPMDIWIGGSDEAEEDTWLWVNGNPMPRGTPFWGTQLRGSSFFQEPSGKESQNCALMWYKNKYFIHDDECDHKASPLCQHQK